MSNSKFTAGVIPEMKRDYIHRLASKGTRIDGRNFDEIRPLEIVKGYAKRAEGSALVRLGRTKVLVGVK